MMTMKCPECKREVIIRPIKRKAFYVYCNFCGAYITRITNNEI